MRDRFHVHVALSLSSIACLAALFQNCSGSFKAISDRSQKEEEDGALKLPSTQDADRHTNVMEVSSGVIEPAYRLSGTCSALGKQIAFHKTPTGLEAYVGKGSRLWAKEMPDDAYIFGGFDFDSDGCVDLGFVRSRQAGQICGSKPMLYTRLEFMNGRTGELHAPVAELLDKCWHFGSAVYPTTQWTDLGVLFGRQGSLALLPYYATTGWYFSFSNGAFRTDGSLLYPSTESYDSIYMAASLNAYNNGQKHTNNPHMANGMILEVGGERRLVFFTSGRVVQYRVGALNASQLVMDTPYITAGRKDLVGRNYGLVQRDSGDPNLLVLISGASAETVSIDARKSAQGAGCPNRDCLQDVWGQIERHVSVYNLQTGAVDDRFFSYAHDDGDAYKFEKRVVYPANVLARVQGSASRYVYNEYAGGDWRLHISQPGRSDDLMTIDHLFIWDIVDIDGDGNDEWVASPTRDPADTGTGYYYPKFRTQLYHWNEATKKLVLKKTVSGSLPVLLPRFRESERTTSRRRIYGVSYRHSGGLPEILSFTSVEPGKDQFIAF